MPLETLLLWIIAAALVLGFVGPYWWWHRRREREGEDAYVEAQKQERQAPASLHPEVNPDICIGTGNCVQVCPEKDVLVLRAGQAVTLNPSRCVGHGLCERSCPVDAIQLVLGSEERGVDIPRIQGNFETNVDGLYVVGELGGMGLIKNAFEQARQCIDGIRGEDRETPEDALDALIVGCGPAGLAASLYCRHHGLRFATLEKEADVGGAVCYYPRKKMVMTNPVEAPGYGTLDFEEIQKEDLIDLWSDLVQTTGVKEQVYTNETFEGAEQDADGVFRAQTSGDTYRTRRIILAIGRRGIPRKLGIPGEDLPNVTYSLLEPEQYQHDRIVVVGGGDSAVEAALALAEEPGNEVRLSYRRKRFSRVKPKNAERIEHAIMDGPIEFLPATNLKEIRPDEVVYEDEHGDRHTLPNDYVFIFIGGILPTDMLEEMGIEIDTKFGEPIAAM